MKGVDFLIDSDGSSSSIALLSACISVRNYLVISLLCAH